MIRLRRASLFIIGLAALLPPGPQTAAADLPDWLELGGEVRLRLEAFDNEDFDRSRDRFGRSGAKGEQDEWILTRLRLHADAHLTQHLRLFTEVLDARLFEDTYHQSSAPGTRRNWEQDRLDLFQAYVDLKLQPGAHLRLGRQRLSFGSGKYLGSYDYWNTPYTFDAARLNWQRSAWHLDLAVGQNVVNRDGRFNDSDDGLSGSATTDDYTVYAAYLTHEPRPGPVTEVYAFALDNENRDSRVLTLGWRQHGTVSSWDYDLELMLQPSGRDKGQPHTAWSVAAEVGYRCWEWSTTPRVFAGYDYASGDESPTDGRSDGFTEVYADNYLQLGYQEFFRRSNLHAVRTGIETSLWGDARAAVTFYSFWVDQDDDNWRGMYNTFVSAQAGRDADNHIGDELDITLQFSFRIWAQEIHTLLGYSVFLPGDFVTATSGGDDLAQEGRLMWTYRF